MTLLKKSKTSLPAIVAIALIALSIAGFSYAHWSEYFWLEGEVTTGDITMAIISVGVDEGEEYGKPWVANTTAKAWDSDGDGWTDTINVTIVNGYPCYEVFIHFTAKNVGTVPVKLQAIEIDAPSELEVDGWNTIGEQIDPGGKKDNTGWVHILQEADEGTTYTFTITFVYVNWNEYVE